MAGNVEVQGMEEVQRNLQRLYHSFTDKKTPNQAIAVELDGWVQRNFDTEGGLTEEGAWQDLAPSTIRARVDALSPRQLKAGPRERSRGSVVNLGTRGLRAFGGANLRILQITGALRNRGFNSFYDEEQAGIGVQFGRGFDWAYYHEHGGKNLPRRQLIPSLPQALDIAMKVYTLYSAKATQEAGGSGS